MFNGASEQNTPEPTLNAGLEILENYEYRLQYAVIIFPNISGFD